MKVENSQGKIYYGMHFYPGVAEYAEPNKEPYRIYLNEDTIRAMGPSFAGRPVFVEHVDEVNEDINELRGEADGWVIESFYNEADGKHWAKFIIVSEEGDKAVQRGLRLSNAYIPKLAERESVWNGVSYQKEVIGGEYEHLAIVSNPRYQESVIMTPDEFKAYNESKQVELKRLSNSLDVKGVINMGLKLFKRQKVENSLDLENTVVELPKSKKEVTITQLVNDMDAVYNMNGYANGDHMVKVGDTDEMSVNDLVKKHIELCNEVEASKAKKNDDGDEDEDDSVDNDALDIDQMGDVGDRGGDESLDNEDDEEKDDKDEKEEKAKKNSIDKTKAIEKAKALKNAHRNSQFDSAPAVELSSDKVARGKALFGS